MPKPFDTAWDRKRWWPPIRSALKSVLGPPAEAEFHALIEFDFGPELGGAPDMMMFRKHIPGIAYVTCELIGRDNQVQNSLGNFELMMCLPKKVAHHWATDMLGPLAYFSFDEKLNPGETSDIGTVPKGSKLKALLFSEYARFTVRKRKAGILLCIGITGAELKYARKKGAEALEQRLKEAKVYPLTIFDRASVV